MLVQGTVSRNSGWWSFIEAMKPSRVAISSQATAVPKRKRTGAWVEASIRARSTISACVARGPSDRPGEAGDRTGAAVAATVDREGASATLLIAKEDRGGITGPRVSARRDRPASARVQTAFPA